MKKISDVDSLRGKAWFWGVKDTSGLPTATAIEWAVSQETFHRRKGAGGGWSYPGRFSKIKGGTKPPGEKLVAKTETLFPGTRYWYDHPFWSIIRLSDSEFHIPTTELMSLKDKTARALLIPPKQIKEGSEAEKSSYIKRAFSHLHESSSIDSLTALIWFVRHSNHISSIEDKYRNYISELILDVCSRVASTPPIYHVQKELLLYINKHFIRLSTRSRWYWIVESGYIYKRIKMYTELLAYIDRLKILEYKAGPDELTTAVHHLSPANIHKISTNMQQGVISNLSGHRGFEVMKQALQRCAKEKSKS